MTSFPKNPSLPTFVCTPMMARVDIGPLIGEVARSLWSSIEQRAGLAIDIDAAGPVVADEAQLHRLLRSITRHVIERVPANNPGEHIVGFSARAFPDDILVIDVRHVQRNWPRGSEPDPTAIDLSIWQAIAEPFTARVDQIHDPLARQCFRVTLRMAM